MVSGLLISKVNARLRLGRLMCGKALPFRQAFISRRGYASWFESRRRSLLNLKDELTEKQSLSAHQGAKPSYGITFGAKP
jgi:hypothetical protein